MKVQGNRENTSVRSLRYRKKRESQVKDKNCLKNDLLKIDVKLPGIEVEFYTKIKIKFLILSIHSPYEGEKCIVG
jgi:hypothetical protein